MTWNYRLVKKSLPDSEHEHFTYGIHEVYYNEDGTAWGVTEDPVDMSAEHLNELKIQWDMLIEAFGRPVIEYDEFCKNVADPAFECNIPRTDEEWDKLEEESLSHDEVLEELSLNDFDPKEYAAELALQNEKEELQHDAEFIGESPEHIHLLIKTLRSQSP